uniref:Glucagon / GIP / secretin / VIP family domain-containing protein n=1 Tax=Callorhinchus milii TaxID=7868 RepID=A0A4W3K5U4_CALMI
MNFLSGQPARLVLLLVALLELEALPSIDRSERHSDGLFTGEFSKLPTTLAARNFISSLLVPKRSSVNLGLSKRQLGDSMFTSRYSSYLRTQAKLKQIAALLQHVQTFKRSNDDNLEKRFNTSGYRMEAEWAIRELDQFCVPWFRDYLFSASNDPEGVLQLIDQFLCPAFGRLIADLKLGTLLPADIPMEK